MKEAKKKKKKDGEDGREIKKIEFGIRRIRKPTTKEKWLTVKEEE